MPCYLAQLRVAHQLLVPAWQLLHTKNNSFYENERHNEQLMKHWPVKVQEGMCYTCACKIAANRRACAGMCKNCTNNISQRSAVTTSSHLLSKPIDVSCVNTSLVNIDFHLSIEMAAKKYSLDVSPRT